MKGSSTLQKREGEGGELLLAYDMMTSGLCVHRDMICNCSTRMKQGASVALGVKGGSDVANRLTGEDAAIAAEVIEKGG